MEITGRCEACAADYIYIRGDARGRTRRFCDACQRERRASLMRSRNMPPSNPYVATCQGCGIRFSPAYKQQRYCAPLCRPPDRRDALKAQIFAEEKNCGICYESIDLSVKWPDGRSATIDHIVPTSYGGGNERSNLQAAHLSCNSAKNHTLKRVDMFTLVRMAVRLADAA